MIDNTKKPSIPTHVDKKTVREKWYPKCPTNLIREDIIEIQIKHGISKKKYTLNKKQIIELFVDYGYGRPAIFDCEEYQNYINDYTNDIKK